MREVESGERAYIDSARANQRESERERRREREREGERERRSQAGIDRIRGG